MLFLQDTLMYCGHCFLPSWGPILQPLWTVVFFQLESGWQFFEKSRCIFGDCGVIDFDWGQKHCQFWIVQFLPHQFYDVFVLHGTTVSIQIVDCILILAIKDLEFHGPFVPIEKGPQCFLGLFDINVSYFQVMVPSSEWFNINSAIDFLDLRFDVRVCMRGFRNVSCDDLSTASAYNLYLLPVCGAANAAFLSHVNWSLWSGTEFWRITYDSFTVWHWCLLTIHYTLLWVCHYRFWLRARKSIVAWLTPVPIFGSGVWQIFVFVAYLSCSRLIYTHLIPLPGLHKSCRGLG